MLLPNILTLQPSHSSKLKKSYHTNLLDPATVATTPSLVTVVCELWIRQQVGKKRSGTPTLRPSTSLVSDGGDLIPDFLSGTRLTPLPALHSYNLLTLAAVAKRERSVLIRGRKEYRKPALPFSHTCMLRPIIRPSKTAAPRRVNHLPARFAAVLDIH